MFLELFCLQKTKTKYICYFLLNNYCLPLILGDMILFSQVEYTYTKKNFVYQYFKKATERPSSPEKVQKRD